MEGNSCGNGFNRKLVQAKTEVGQRNGGKTATDESALLVAYRGEVCAVFVAQQRGIRVSTAFKKIPDQILDVWLGVAEFALEVWTQNIDQLFGPSDGEGRTCDVEL